MKTTHFVFKHATHLENTHARPNSLKTQKVRDSLRQYLSEESPPGLCDIGSTARLIQGAVGISCAGVLIHIFPQRRSRLGLFCSTG